MPPVRVSDSISRGGGPITSKQVAFLLARAREVGIQGEEAILEWLEYGASLGQYYRLEDFPQNKFQQALDLIAYMKENQDS